MTTLLQKLQTLSDADLQLAGLICLSQRLIKKSDKPEKELQLIRLLFGKDLQKTSQNSQIPKSIEISHIVEPDYKVLDEALGEEWDNDSLDTELFEQSEKIRKAKKLETKETETKETETKETK